LRYAIHTRINQSTMMSHYEYLYGVWLTNLPLDGSLFASLSKEEVINMALEILQEDMMEFYNRAKAKTDIIPVFEEDQEGFYLFEFEGTALDVAGEDLDMHILGSDNVNAGLSADLNMQLDQDNVEGKLAAESLLHLDHDDDDGGKIPAKETSQEAANIIMKEQVNEQGDTPMNELADIFLEEYGGNYDLEEEKVSKEVETEVEREEKSDALLSPNKLREMRLGKSKY
jgi:hypothetical protein